jgi:predicted PurR-regulated permease PerM
LGGALALVPFWAPIVAATWAAALTLPIHRALTRRIQRRTWAAALITVGLALAFVVPLSIAALSLSAAALELGHRLQQANSGSDALRWLAANRGPTGLDLRQLDAKKLFELLKQHGAGALTAAKTLFGTAAVAALALVVFVSAFYTFLVKGSRLHEWLLLHAPLERGHAHRLSNVFLEVGRGMLIGVGLTAALQGGVASIGYAVCGVPQPLVLGIVTAFAALIPSVGAGLVWVPVVAGLALAGRPGAATAMAGIGCFVSLVDNLVRPWLARYGELRMNGLLLFVAMLGGIAIFGAFGLLLGPLLVRLAIEGLEMLRELDEQA